MNMDELRSIFGSVEDCAWEGSWSHRGDVDVVAIDNGDLPCGHEYVHPRGFLAIVINAGASLVPAINASGTLGP
jgi:hypothetical protein